MAVEYYRSKFTGEEVEAYLESIQDKQDKIEDLRDIRSGAQKGATALQSSDVARVAMSGSYNDLQDRPEVSQFVTKGELGAVNENQLALIADNKTRIDATASEVLELADEVDTLNGDGEGSIKDTVSKEIAKVVASAPDDLDTLREIADFIEADSTRAAEIITSLDDLKKRMDSLESESIPFEVMTESAYEILPEKEDKLYFLYSE